MSKAKDLASARAADAAAETSEEPPAGPVRRRAAAEPVDAVRVKVVLGVRGHDRDLEVGEVLLCDRDLARVLTPHVVLTDEPVNADPQPSDLGR